MDKSQPPQFQPQRTALLVKLVSVAIYLAVLHVIFPPRWYLAAANGYSTNSSVSVLPLDCITSAGLPVSLFGLQTLITSDLFHRQLMITSAFFAVSFVTVPGLHLSVAAATTAVLNGG